MFACGNGSDADEQATVTVASSVPLASSTPSSDGRPELALPAGIEVFVEFPRYLHAARRVEVGFDNRAGDTDVTITAVALRSPLFEPVPAEARDTAINVGRRRDLQIGLGPSLCPAPSGPSLVEVTAEIGGLVQHGLVEVDATPLERISAQECGREFVLGRVGIEYAPAFTVADGVVETNIDLTRVEGDEPVAVTGVRGSVLLELIPATSATPLAVLAGDGTDVSVPVRLRVIRCDPHAVIESKKTFELSMWVAIGERDPQHLVVAPTGELRAALEQLIEDCLDEQLG